MKGSDICDGFGNSWSRCKLGADCGLHVVRPGKARCWCEDQEASREKVQGARSFYDTVIKRGEEVLAEVKSSWCCIDAETLRPARIAAEVQAYFFRKVEPKLL